VEKETKEAIIVIPKMGTEIINPIKKLGEEEKMLEVIQENCKGANPLNLFSLAKSSFLFHVKLSIGFSNFVIFFVVNGKFLNTKLIPCEV
jgi:hypothetical protein